MESHRSIKLVLGLLTLPMFAGCASVSEMLAGKQRDVEMQRAYDAHRQSLDDVQPSSPAPKRLRDVQAVQYLEIENEELAEHDAPLPFPSSETTDEGEPLPLSQTGTTESLPIDLPTALRLAGANNLQIAFAIEQVQQARARADAANVLWVPSLNAGVVYNNHAGRIQATPGEVIDASRNSLFVGVGAGTGSAPLAAGSSGPARMFVDLPLVNILFEPLAARQAAQGAQANETATFNDALLATSLAYFDLLHAHALIDVTQEAVTNAEELARITGDFAQSGQGLQADADRAQAELASRRRDVFQAKEAAAVNSAELVRMLRIGPTTQLCPTETKPILLQLIDDRADPCDLIGQAYSIRPELAAASASIQETWYRNRQEHWRPLMPHLYAGFSGGGFGGAPGSSVDSFGDRTDFDIAAIWQVENLGLGNRARRLEQTSVHRQAHIVHDSWRDRIAAEVVQAFEQVRFRGQQIAMSEAQVRSATKALNLNLEGIRGGVLRPIEIQQAIGALASARRQYLDAVIDYNRAQLALLRAIGQPVTDANRSVNFPAG